MSSQAVDWREGRRLRAWELKQTGWSQSAIAQALGVTPGAVSQWFARASKDDPTALRRRKPKGPPRRLTANQLASLPGLLSRGTQPWGFRGEVWTRQRISEVIRLKWGVSYHPSHVGRLLREIDWSLQIPARRARQRDEAAIDNWSHKR
jgi:transposase